MTTRTSEQTYYEILEVNQGAGHHEIVAAYQKAKDAYSPDSPALYTMFTKEEAEALRKLIEEAFLILGNQSKRKEYDQILLARGRKATTLDLPDFSPAPMPNAQVKVAENVQRVAHDAPSPTGSVPQGFAKSRLSVYEVKPEFESELATQEIFDGALLRKIRLYKNINLEQMSKETRISRSYLASVESDDYEALPAPVFLRGFIVQMARILGLNENKVAASYMSRVKKPE